MNERNKILMGLMKNEPMDSKQFLSAQIAYMESLKAKDRLDALFSNKKEKRTVVKKRANRKIKKEKKIVAIQDA
jgi:hypothetical protein